MKQEKIKELLLKASPELCRRHGVDLAYLYGSAHSDRFGLHSDIDIAVRFEKTFASADYFLLTTPLETELQKLLNGKIDLTILNLAQPLLRYEVIKNGLILFAKDNERLALFHIRAYRDYEDFCHAQDFHINALKKRLGVSA